MSPVSMVNHPERSGSNHLGASRKKCGREKRLRPYPAEPVSLDDIRSGSAGHSLANPGRAQGEISGPCLIYDPNVRKISNTFQR